MVSKSIIRSVAFVTVASLVASVAAAGPVRGRDRLATPKAAAAPASGPTSAAGGEISVFIGVIQGGQETPDLVPPHLGYSNAFGNVFMTHDASTDIVCYSVSYNGLANETVSHFHVAPPNKNSHVHAWPPEPASLPLGSPKVGCTDPLSEELIHALHAGRWYLQIHSADYVLGEIRSQVLPIQGVRYDLSDEGGIGGH